MIRYLLSFVVGAGVGSICTYFLTREKLQKEADLRIDSMRAYVESIEHVRSQQIVEEPFEVEEIDIPKQSSELVVERQPVRTQYQNFFGRPAPTEETAYPEDDQDVISLAESEAEYLERYFSEEPMFLRIPEDEMGEMGDACPEDLVFFWANDNIFTNDDMEILDDPAMYVGPDFVNAFSPDDSDELDICIRNKKLQKDIRFTKMTGVFTGEIVMKYNGEAEYRTT